MIGILNTILNASGHKSCTSIINLILLFLAYFAASFAKSKDGTAQYIKSGLSIFFKYFFRLIDNIL